MASGGARARSGPAPDPRSAASEKRNFRVLPARGFKGNPPVFPLPPVVITADGGVDEAASKVVNDREKKLWKWVWTTPQASVWKGQRWRYHSIAMWVRMAVACERFDAKASDRTALLRLGEDIGLSSAGLARNGWVIGEENDEAASTATKARGGSRERLRVVGGNG